MTEEIACLDCRIQFNYESNGNHIEAVCPKCGGRYGWDNVHRTDSTSFVYAYERELNAMGKSLWKGDALTFTDYTS